MHALRCGVAVDHIDVWYWYRAGSGAGVQLMRRGAGAELIVVSCCYAALVSVWYLVIVLAVVDHCAGGA